MHAVLHYLWHWLTAVNSHSLHSPFLFDFYKRIIEKPPTSAAFASIEEIRQSLINSRQIITVQNLGATSKVDSSSQRPVSAIAGKGLSPARLSRMLYAIIQQYESKIIVELGTSFGINTLYLAANPGTKVFTFEGCPNIAAIARKNFAAMKMANISLIEGNINERLPEFCQQQTTFDLAFMDANHQYLPTLTYFETLLASSHEQSIIVVDDIYWSKEMTRAWNKIKQHPKVTATFDLYQAGIVFLKPGLGNLHYKVFC